MTTEMSSRRHERIGEKTSAMPRIERGRYGERREEGLKLRAGSSNSPSTRKSTVSASLEAAPTQGLAPENVPLAEAANPYKWIIVVAVMLGTILEVLDAFISIPDVKPTPT